MKHLFSIVLVSCLVSACSTVSDDDTVPAPRGSNVPPPSDEDPVSNPPTGDLPPPTNDSNETDKPDKPDEPDNKDGALCVGRGYNYEFQFEEELGSCGKLNSVVMYVDDKGKIVAPSQCTSKQVYSGCDVDWNVTCNVGNGTTVSQWGYFTWFDDGISGKGKLEIEKTGSENCTSLYRVTAKRQS